MPFDADSWNAFSQDGLSTKKQLMIVSSLIRACKERAWLGVFSSSQGSLSGSSVKKFTYQLSCVESHRYSTDAERR
jgi:hypothetical protein